ncbi:MAG: hypothetical protein LUC91_03575 [Prevotella sp.]|nr:hypothetical protein [Prevotella sp.]
MKKNFISKSKKCGLFFRFTFLFMALFSMQLSTYAVDASDIQELVLDEEVSVEGSYFSKHYFSYTATQDGTLSILATDVIYRYTDETFTEETSEGWTNVGAESGKKRVTLEVEAGNTYYLYFQLQSTTPGTYYATLLSADAKPEITYCNPAEGSVLSIEYDQPISLKFSMDVTVGTATLTSGEQTDTLTLNSYNGYYNYYVRDIVYEWLSSGAVKEGDDIIFTLADVQSSNGAVYGDDGTITINYLAPASPTELSQESLPEVFLPWWNAGNENGMMTLTFTNELSTEEDLAPNVELRYGQVESEAGIYSETITPIVDGNTLTVDFTGVSRLRKEMLAAATEKYSTVTVRVTNLHDVNGNYVYTTGQGTVGSLTYELDYKEFTIIPSDSTVVESISQVVIEYPSGITLKDASNVTIQNFVEQEVAVGTSVEAVTEEGSDMPTKIIVTLDKTITDDGYYFVVIPKGSLMINYPEYVSYDYKISEVFTIDRTTGVGSVSIENASNGNGKIYTIDGQLVKSPTKKGIYIVNGKKIVVK